MPRPKKTVEQKIYDFVVQNPWSRAEEIGSVVDLQGDDLSYRLRKLRDAGHIKSRGVTRGTTYAATKKAFRPEAAA